MKTHSWMKYDDELVHMIITKMKTNNKENNNVVNVVNMTVVIEKMFV